jgi:hypothetical protein
MFIDLQSGEVELPDGRQVVLRPSEALQDGEIGGSVELREVEDKFELAIRVPSWPEGVIVSIPRPDAKSL